jgi:hypothetical protein
MDCSGSTHAGMNVSSGSIQVGKITEINMLAWQLWPLRVETGRQSIRRICAGRMWGSLDLDFVSRLISG